MSKKSTLVIIITDTHGDTTTKVSNNPVPEIPKKTKTKSMLNLRIDSPREIHNPDVSSFRRCRRDNKYRVHESHRYLGPRTRVLENSNDNRGPWTPCWSERFRTNLRQESDPTPGNETSYGIVGFGTRPYVNTMTGTPRVVSWTYWEPFFPTRSPSPGPLSRVDVKPWTSVLRVTIESETPYSTETWGFTILYRYRVQDTVFHVVVVVVVPGSVPFYGETEHPAPRVTSLLKWETSLPHEVVEPDTPWVIHGPSVLWHG